MSLNGYLVTAVIVLGLLSPLFVLTAPLWLIWLYFQRREQRVLGYRSLLPFMARTAELYARAMIRGDAPGGDWGNVSRNLDRYIAETRSPRVWRLQLLILIMEFAPLVRLRPPFSLLSLPVREAFVARNLTHGRGVMRIVSLGRQLMRLCYYATPATHQRMGFVPMNRRAAWRNRDKQPAELAEAAT
jgi:hypothetical protein